MHTHRHAPAHKHTHNTHIHTSQQAHKDNTHTNTYIHTCTHTQIDTHSTLWNTNTAHSTFMNLFIMTVTLEESQVASHSFIVSSIRLLNGSWNTARSQKMSASTGSWQYSSRRCVEVFTSPQCVWTGFWFPFMFCFCHLVDFENITVSEQEQGRHCQEWAPVPSRHLCKRTGYRELLFPQSQHAEANVSPCH